MEFRVVRRRTHSGCGKKVRFDGRVYFCRKCGLIKPEEVEFHDFHLDEPDNRRKGEANA